MHIWGGVIFDGTQHVPECDYTIDDNLQNDDSRVIDLDATMELPKTPSIKRSLKEPVPNDKVEVMKNNRDLKAELVEIERKKLMMQNERLIVEKEKVKLLREKLQLKREFFLLEIKKFQHLHPTFAYKPDL